MASHRRSAKERRAQRVREKSRFIGRLLRCCQEVAVRWCERQGGVLDDLADVLSCSSPNTERQAEGYQTNFEPTAVFVVITTQTEESDRTTAMALVEPERRQHKHVFWLRTITTLYSTLR